LMSHCRRTDAWSYHVVASETPNLRSQ